MPATDLTVRYRRRVGRAAGLVMHPERLRRRMRWRRRRLARERLLSLLPADCTCAEVGTWRGDFAAKILNVCNPGRLYLIDSWEHRSEQEYSQASYGGKVQDGQAGMDAIYEGVIDRFRTEIDTGQVVIVRARSTQTAASLPDESLDWVYIDADHSYGAVKRDLEAYYPLVKSGGLLAGDDYGLDDRWFGQGVTRAVDEFAARCAGQKIIGTQFLLRKP